MDQGQSWKAISPDLTRNDRTRENGGRLEDIYCTVFTIAPSPLDKNTIWAGSDDGLIHVTRDGGKTWNDVTPRAIEPWTRINIIDASPEDAATAYAAVNRYQMDDFRPYIYRTHDYGKNWTLVTSGIPEDTFVRTVRQDPAQRKLLYAGTETGVYVSFDDGDHWQSLQLNLPIVPITDLTFQGNDLIASTQGRAFWVLDDVTADRADGLAGREFRAACISAASRVSRRQGWPRGGRGGAGFSPTGVIVDYYVANASSQPVTIEFQDAAGQDHQELQQRGTRGARAGGRFGRGRAEPFRLGHALSRRARHRRRDVFPGRQPARSGGHSGSIQSEGQRGRSIRNADFRNQERSAFAHHAGSLPQAI